MPPRSHPFLQDKAYLVPLIMGVNVAVFIMWLLFSPAFMATHFLVSWEALEQGRLWTLLTSVFSHNMLLHILINMLVLKGFGTLLERMLGSTRFFNFYLSAGIIGSLSHCIVTGFLLKDPRIPALGASGAIAGVILVFALLFPKVKIYLFGIAPIPALWGAVAFIGLDVWGLIEQTKGGGLPIGHGAHLGGALTGIVYYFVFVKPRIKSNTRY